VACREREREREKEVASKGSRVERENECATLSHLRERQEACLVCFTDPGTSVENSFIYISKWINIQKIFFTSGTADQLEYTSVEKKIHRKKIKLS